MDLFDFNHDGEVSDLERIIGLAAVLSEANPDVEISVTVTGACRVREKNRNLFCVPPLDDILLFHMNGLRVPRLQPVKLMLVVVKHQNRLTVRLFDKLV